MSLAAHLSQGACKKMTAEVIPAILTKKFSTLEESLSRIQGAASFVQIDAVDGIFAPGKTWPYVDGDEFEKMVAQDKGLPFWEDFDFQFDLMVAHPKEEALRFVQAGAASVVIHAAAPGAREALEFLQEYRAGVSLGAALLPGATVGDLQTFSGLYDFVQVMGIAEVGAQGRPFDERTLTLVAALRAAHPNVRIQVDGGVSIKNCQTLVRAGANALIVGSAIFGSDNPAAAYSALYTKSNA